ncbi:hypothetical protein MalM25_06600 [Planctomycetes bacterium MalM25]|nr:hypothetical protein MalM25_06600 [Planctomycetes bacterium MalM25]
MSKPHIEVPEQTNRSLDPFRRAVLRGLGVLLPPLLTVVIFLWVGGTVSRYVLTPLTEATRYVLVEYQSDIRKPEDFSGATKPFPDSVTGDDGQQFRKTPDGLYIPLSVYNRVEEGLTRNEADPATAREWYGRHVDDVWLRPWIVVPIFLSVFLLLLYTIGKFLAAGIGRFFYGQFESLINRVPLVSNVYSSVKQVTDFLFTDPDLDITRVVAVEYPRKGIWTVAFATGESLLDVESAANEPVMTVLIPTSPMPFTGFTITVKKSETVDLNMTIDQAFQFVVSCGVVVPTQQVTREVLGRAGEVSEQEKPETSATGVEPNLGDGQPNGAVGSTAAEVRHRLNEAIERQAHGDAPEGEARKDDDGDA